MTTGDARGPRRPILFLQLLTVTLSAWLLMSASGGTAPEAATAPPRDRIADALEVLARAPTGKRLIEQAKGVWKVETQSELLQFFKWGSVSRTDAVLTRHFNPKTGLEERERRLTVYLKSDQALEDLSLDIAHELTHATAQPVWDPYDPGLTAGRYIWNAIEGAGGEVEAVLTECEVGLELAERYSISVPRCKRYEGNAASDRRKRVVADFYRVGKWHAELLTQLGGERSRFPQLSSENPQLFSSTGHSPYPVALFKEFQEISQVACANSRRRLASLPARSPAAFAQKNLSAFLKERCAF